MALISYKKKFIFVHIYKCAGTSMKEALNKYCKPSMPDRILINTGLKKSFNNIPSQVPHHPTALEIKHHISENIYNSFYKFTFVRNPWDMEVSLYNYMLKNSKHRQHALINKMSCFDEYIEWRVQHDLHSQAKYILDERENNIVDFIGRFENLEKDFKTVCENLNILTKLPHINKNNHDSYKNYYNNHTKRLIKEFFLQDIELFNYSY